MGIPESPGFRLGENQVFPLEGRIEGPKGCTNVQPRVMSVLMCLVDKPGEVVTRNQIFDSVWGKSIVTEDSLTRCISELRRALDDKPPRFVKTIHKVGYCLMGTVEELPATTAEASPGLELHNEIGKEQSVSDQILCALVGIFEVDPAQGPFVEPSATPGCTLEIHRAGNTMMVVTNSVAKMVSAIEFCGPKVRGSICAGDVLMGDPTPSGGAIQRATSLFRSASEQELRISPEAIDLIGRDGLPSGN